MNGFVAAFREYAEHNRDRSANWQGSEIRPVGMFRVRKQVTVSQLVRNILSAVQGDADSIQVDGTDITVHRPKQIAVTITGLRKYEFQPDFPVDVSLMGISVSVNIRSVEIVTDEETGQPAVLVTTAGALKPDLMIVCDLDARKPETPERADDDEASLRDVVTMLCNQHLVPEKYRDRVIGAIGVAYGPRRIAHRVLVAQGAGPIEGGVSGAEAETVARSIVEGLVQERVVNCGMLFWFQLGYWLVKIITELLRYQNSRSRRQAAVVASSAGTPNV